MGGFSLWHWLVVGILILLLFGGNRFSSMMGDIAKGLKSFKKGLSEEEDKPAEPRRLEQDRTPDTRPDGTRAAEPEDRREP